MATAGGAFISSGTGRILTCIRPAPNCKVDSGSMARNRPVSMSRTRSVTELETICGAGGVKPAERKASEISAVAMLSDSGISHGSPQSSARSILRRRDHELLMPATTRRRSSNRNSALKSSPKIAAGTRPITQSSLRSRSIAHKRPGVSIGDMQFDPRIPLGKACDHGGDEAFGIRRCAADAQFPYGRIRQERDLLHASTQFIENDRPAAQEGPPIGRWLSPLRRAVKETDVERIFKVGDRLRHDRVRDGKSIRRPRHAPGLRHRKKDMRIAQFDPAANPLCPLHALLL